MHASLLFPNEYLCAADLQGKDITLTIAELKLETLNMTDGGTEDKWVLYFKETDAKHSSGKSKFRKRLVLNKTNAKLIVKALKETETENWIGTKITLRPDRCKAFGEMVDCIRVKTS